MRSKELGANGLNIWKKLFRKNADEMYEEALRAEHSAPKRYKKLISDASVLGHIDAQLRYGKELVRGGFGDGHKVDGLNDETPVTSIGKNVAPCVSASTGSSTSGAN